MSIGEHLAMELEHEAIATRKVLERLPEDKFGWKPHEKSMSLGRLGSHTAEMVGWGAVTISQNEYDMGADYKPWEAKTSAELVEKFDSGMKTMLEALRKADDGIWGETWALKQGEKTYFAMPRMAVLRSMIINHTIHHRAQLTVYLRLLNLPVPAVYGPSADEQS